MKEYIYYWYHHMISPARIKAVHRSIEDKNFKAFVEHYKNLNAQGILQGEYYPEFHAFIPVVYLPDTISVFNTETNQYEEPISVLNENNFNKITVEDYECG